MHVLSDTVAQAATLEFPNLCFQREKKKRTEAKAGFEENIGNQVPRYGHPTAVAIHFSSTTYSLKREG